ncbi:hypothetical protein KAF25_011073 [Fusarium avenaceum]|uniref:Zn(2)-C6 fungal-type domain-containing protein n=1 Tax=Fusarium avenaceum TaxID=40199 RepID=A0A9P7GU63_9HYPO|nr:hypothetical protein KAF25_011073 [Fusarium avenaceum]
MVGVPGKSKACSNCRERRLKCDLEKPYCARCTRNNRVCGGYERPRIFVHQFQKPTSPAKTTSSPNVFSTTPHRWTFYVPPLSDSTPFRMSPDSTVHEQRQFISCFINEFCPVLDVSLKQCDRLHHYWVYVLPHIFGTVDLLDKSILTLSAAFLGRNSNDVHLRKRSMVMYGNAIRHLGKAMSTADFYPSDIVLATIQCLGMSEVYSPPSQEAADHGWVSHIKGGAELLRIRGASILDTKLGRDLFIRFRAMSLWAQFVFEAPILVKGQPNIHTKPFAFTDPNLRNISLLASRDSHYSMLFHLLLDIPELLHDVNLLSTLGNNAVDTGCMVQDIFLRAVTITESLRTWLDGFMAQHPVSYTWSNTPSETPYSIDAFPLRFDFPNLLTAQFWIHYWAAMILLMRCIMVCQKISLHSGSTFTYDYQRLAYSPILAGGVAISDASAVALHLADNICHSAAYSNDGDKGMSGPIMLLFPLWIAKDTFANDGSGLSRKKELYCVEALKALASRGMQISGALINHSIKDEGQTC